MSQQIHIWSFATLVLLIGLIGGKLICSNGPIDLVIVLDESGSITDKDFQTELTAALQLINGLTIGTDDKSSRVGFVLFSDVARVGFELTKYTTYADISQAILQSKQSKGLTDIAAGMHVAITEVFERAPARNGVPRRMVIITDGMDTTDVAAQHALASMEDIKIYAYGVGSEVNDEELVRATGSMERVFKVATFDDLVKVLSESCFDEETSHGPRGCECNIKHTWLDLVFIIDSSKAVNSQDFMALKNFVASFVGKIPVSQQIGAFSRVAVINMGEEVTVIGDLKTFQDSQSAVTAIRAMQYKNSNQANLRQAMILAQDMISQDERPNVQNVVVVITSKDEPCEYLNQSRSKFMKAVDQNPCRIAAHLRETGNIVMTMGVKYDGREQYPKLNVASKCYAMNFDLNMATSFIDAICRANCYCLAPYMQFTDKCSEWGECVYQQGQPLAFYTAQRTCEDYNTHLVDVLSQKKDAFIKSMEMEQETQYTSYWLGAQSDGGVYKWGNTTIEADDYTNWAVGNPDLKKGACVYEDAQGWHSEICDFMKPAHYFVCQKRACDTENYCNFDALFHKAL